MVSKLEILSRYYQITISTITDGYFEYQENTYLLTKKQVHPYIQNNYTHYSKQYYLEGFYMVKNCYGSYDSEGYTLFTFQIQRISLDTVLDIGSKYIEKEYLVVEYIKQRWCETTDAARKSISKHASSIQLNEQYVVLSYYYLGLAEHAIHLLNSMRSKKLPASIQHHVSIPYYQYLLAPTNLTISSRVRDLVAYYKQGYIDIEKVSQCITNYQLSYDELIYMYARTVYPSEFLNSKKEENLDVEMIVFYQRIQEEQQKIKAMHHLLSNYIQLPILEWI